MVIIGLDDAGKTTMVASLQGGECSEVDIFLLDQALKLFEQYHFIFKFRDAREGAWEGASAPPAFS